MLKIVHLNDEIIEEAKPKKLSKKELLHQEAVLSMENARAHDRIKAKQMFAEEWAEVEKERAELLELKTKHNLI